jgi:hypothetical protein
MKPIDIVASFIDEKLGGDIQRLATFPLGDLRKDNVYGCPGRNFDSDDTELMRAIYCVVFGDTWKNLSMENLGDEKLRGDTMNTYNTLFSHPWSNLFTERWNPDNTLLDKMKVFQTTCYTMGNMTVLPDRRIGDWSINKHRGCHDQWHDYEDRFLAALYQVLMQDPACDPDLQELVELNWEDFAPFYDEDGWVKFISGNYLDYYVDSNWIPLVTSKGFTYWRGGYTNKERFFAECHRYIDFSTDIINKRAWRMIEKIKAELAKR